MDSNIPLRPVYAPNGNGYGGTQGWPQDGSVEMGDGGGTNPFTSNTSAYAAPPSGVDSQQPAMMKPSGTFDSLPQEEKPKDKNQITEWQAAWNVTSAIQGVITLSLPFCILQGGLWAVIAIIVMGLASWYTGYILVDCLYEERDGELVRVRDSYVSIAERCWGRKLGGYFVNSIQIAEQVLTCSSHFLLCGSLLYHCFPKWPVSQTVWCVLCCASLVPVVFLQRLTTLSKVSFWSTVALFPIAISILFHCLLHIADWDWSQLRPKWDPMFPATFGVLAINYTSQVFLPMLESNMVDRTKYKPMVKWTHATAILSKLVFCLLTVFTYGDRTRSIITNNLPKPIFRITVNVFIVFKVLLTYPLYYFSAIDLIETTFFQQKPETIFPSCYTDDFPRALHPWAIAARFGLVLSTLVLALFIPFYTLLLGIIGSFTGFMLVCIFPCSFHLQLKWAELDQRAKALDIVIIFVSIICIFFGVFSSAYELNEVATKGAKEVFERV